MPERRERTQAEREAARRERELRRESAKWPGIAEDLASGIRFRTPGATPSGPPPAGDAAPIEPSPRAGYGASTRQPPPMGSARPIGGGADAPEVGPAAEGGASAPDRPDRAGGAEQPADGGALGRDGAGRPGEDGALPPIRLAKAQGAGGTPGRQATTTRRAAGGRRPPRAPQPRGGAAIARRAVAVVMLVLGLVVVWFLVELFQPFHGSGHGSVTVTIPHDASSSEVGDLLARDGVISSSFFFELRATLEGDRGSLLPGTYHMPLGISYSQALSILTTPPPAAKVTYVTITEGLARTQINHLLRSQHVPGSYLRDTIRSPLLHPSTYGAPAHTPSLEGFLFPDTYQVYEPLRIPQLVDDQLQTFKQEFATVKMGFARSRHMSRYDVLIIASIIQAEAATAHDMPLVASVIYNRLANGMSLGSDATTRYATGNYTKQLTESQINSPSPWNTRDHLGLPPTPINSPGLAAIEAAAHPKASSYLYFIVKPCGNGALEYATTYPAFQVEVQAYDAASAKRGGNSPEFCSHHG